MTLTQIFHFFPVLLGILGIGNAGQPDGVRRLVVEDQIILRVPVRPQIGMDLEERKGPKCIASDTIRGAFAGAGDHVDFLTTKRQLVRAELGEECPALDFYEGFYLNPQDGKVCAKRESVRSRMGASCRIERFRLLVPKDR